MIGSILPLTGDGASYGKEIKNGIDLAVEQENERGGVSGRKIAVRYEDSAGDPKQAVSAMQKILAQYRPQSIIGDAFSSPALAIAPIANREKIVMISPTASSPKLTPPGQPATGFRGGLSRCSSSYPSRARAEEDRAGH